MSVVSGIMGASATKSAARKAAAAQTSSTQMGVDFAKEQFDKNLALLQPYIEAGYRGVSRFEAAASGAPEPGLPGAEITDPTLPGLDLDLPVSPDAELGFEFDPNDPNYLLQQEDLERSINRGLAARGSYNSRMGVNALAEGHRRLQAGEVDRQYGKAVDKYGRLVDKYGRDYSAATDKYGREYSAGIDKYGRDVDKYGREYQTAIDKYNIKNALVQQNLNKWFGLANVGRGTATASGTLGAQTGGQVSQAYQSQGSNLAGIYANQGNQLSNTYQNMIPNAIGSAYYGTKAIDQYKQNQNTPNTNYWGAGGASGSDYGAQQYFAGSNQYSDW